MDSNKKQQQNYTRTSSSKACQPTDSTRKSTELQANKPWPRNSNRREQTSAPRNDQQRNSKQGSSAKVRPNVDKRPRPRGGPHGGLGGNAGAAYYGAACTTEDVFAAGARLATMDEAYAVATTGGGAVAKSANHDYYELNSVYAPGSKKQNLNHLLNFHYAPRESDYATMNLSVFGRAGGASNMYRHNQGNAANKKQRYNKEQFLQANFQFVIKSSVKPPLSASPDTLIDWEFIEQINIQTTEEPQCPICLYPPIAAKLTRCGHAYCWPCILHYLALSDKKWRKCPICYEAIHLADLKSTTIVQQQTVNVGEQISFQLMRRKKGSMYIEKYTTDCQSVERYPQLSSNEEAKLFSKFLLAKHADILDIIERERRELLADVDTTCPEFVFIQQALDLLNERRHKLGENAGKTCEEELIESEILNQKQEIEFKNNTTETEQLQDIETEVLLENCTVEETDTSSISSAPDTVSTTTNTNGKTTANATKYYYFYQTIDAQNIYLHPLNVKMLQACYGTLDRAPPYLNARILQKEHHSMDEDHRRKFTCLGHLPLTCQYAVVEVDLQPPVVTDGILKLFKNDLLFRKKERQRREREERKREKQINEINDRQMGKLIASATNLNLGSAYEFPTCGFEEALVSADALDSNFPAAAVNALATPSVAATTSYSTVAVSGESPKLNFLSALDFPSTFNGGSHTWAKPATTVNVTVARRTIADRSSESETPNDLVAFDAAINLSDVLAEAISQKKQNAGAAAVTGNKSKKQKKGKKMVPVFCTGMNFNGN